MTRTTEDVVPPGTLRAGTQPALQASPELVLRPWSGSDKDAVLEAFSARDIQYWHLRSVASEREVDAWLDERRRSWSSEQGASWAVVDSDDRVLGQVALRGLNLAMGVTQVSYWVLPDARGGGVATAAVRALSDWSLDEVGLHRVWLMHSAPATTPHAVSPVDRDTRRKARCERRCSIRMAGMTCTCMVGWQGARGTDRARRSRSPQPLQSSLRSAVLRWAASSRCVDDPLDDVSGSAFGESVATSGDGDVEAVRCPSPPVCVRGDPSRLRPRRRRRCRRRRRRSPVAVVRSVR